MDTPKRRATTRRRFLRDSAAILVAGGPAFDLLNRNAPVSVRVSPLKPATQYRAEAAQFETAFSEFASVSNEHANKTFN